MFIESMNMIIKNTLIVKIGPSLYLFSAQSCGIPALVNALRNGEDGAGEVNHLVTLPYGTAAAWCMPRLALMCMGPCHRTPAESANVRQIVLNAGVLQAAVDAIDRERGIHGGLRVLEVYAPFAPAAAVVVGAQTAALRQLRSFKADLHLPAPGEPLSIDMTLLSGTVVLVSAAAAVLATLVAHQDSGLLAEERQAAAAEMAPFVRAPLSRLSLGNLFG